MHRNAPTGRSSPVEAERIYTAIGLLKRKHQKPVVAVINNLGASAAFLIALHADKIVAGRYSLVGSIGAIMAPWQLDRAIAKYDVSQRVYASGKLKSFLNPFTPVTPEVDMKAQKLVDQLGTYFVEEVKARRGAHLKAGVDVTTGEVWAGPEAKEIGLVDAVGTLDDYVATTWGVQTYDFGPSAQGLQLLGRSIQDTLVGSVQRLVTSGVAIRRAPAQLLDRLAICSRRTLTLPATHPGRAHSASRHQLASAQPPCRFGAERRLCVT